MENFVKYAQYFNHFYKDKNYKKEVDYVDLLIKRYSGKRNKSLLDIGCGTGNHDLWFLKKGYRVVGIDRSSEMISLAKDQTLPDSRVEFYTADACRFNLQRKFDIAISLFHVVSYLTTNDIVAESLQNIYRHLKTGGLFIFDFWYGPAVLMQRPRFKTKTVNIAGKLIKRTAIPKINFDTNTVDVYYKIRIKNIKNNFEKEISEHHIMRYFFLPELSLMLETAGFKLLKCLKWMSLKEGLGWDSWSGLIIAKK